MAGKYCTEQVATFEGFHDPEGPSMRFRVKCFQVPNSFRLKYLGPKPSIIRLITGDFDWNRPVPSDYNPVL